MSDKDKKLTKFDFVVGNPPYQNGKLQVYPAFFQSAKDVANCIDMIFPTGWQDPKTANGLIITNNKETKEDKQIVFIKNEKDVFPNVTGAKDTNIVLWKKDYDNKLDGCQKIITHDGKEELKKLLYSTEQIELPQILTKIVSKVKAKDFQSLTDVICIQNNLLLDVVYAEYPEVKSNIGSDGRDKRFENNIFEKVPAIFTIEKQSNDDLHVITTEKHKRVWKYVNKKYVEQTHEALYKYKLFINHAASSATFGSTLSDFIIASPKDAFTRSYISIGYSDNINDIYNLEKYIKTKFARALLYTLKFTKMNNKAVWANIPLQNFTDKSDIDWSKSIKEIDQQLYKKYGLSEDEIKFIEEKVKEME